MSTASIAAAIGRTRRRRARTTEAAPTGSAVAYLRVSTDEQAESGAGLAAQQEGRRKRRNDRGARLQSLLDSRTEQPDLAELRRKVTQIAEAVRTTVPREMWADIVAKLEEPERPLLHVDDVSDDLAEAYEPDDFDDSSYDY